MPKTRKKMDSIALAVHTVHQTSFLTIFYPRLLLVRWLDLSDLAVPVR